MLRPIPYWPLCSGLLQAYPSISCRNLPRVWDTTEPGSLPEPQRHDLSTIHPLRIGGDFDEDRWQVSGGKGAGDGKGPTAVWVRDQNNVAMG